MHYYSKPSVIAEARAVVERHEKALGQWFVNSDYCYGLTHRALNKLRAIDGLDFMDRLNLEEEINDKTSAALDAVLMRSRGTPSFVFEPCNLASPREVADRSKRLRLPSH